MTFIIAKDVFNDAAEPIVQQMLDWKTAKSFEGQNISAQEWHSLPGTLRSNLADAHPKMDIDDRLFAEFEMLVSATRNLNTIYIVSRDIVQAHLTAHETGDKNLLDKALDQLERRVKWAEKNSMGTITPNPIHAIAAMLSDSDMGLMKKLDVVEQQRTSNNGPLAGSKRKTLVPA